jgi:hypothetical protein
MELKKRDLLSILPLDVTCEIFSQLNPEIVLQSRRLSKHFAVVLTHDAIWRNIVKRVYGVVTKDPAADWYSFYKTLIERWFLWDDVAHHPGISIDSTGRVATCEPSCKNDTHLPIRGRQGVKEGRYFFEVSVKHREDSKPSFSSLLCAIGVADNSMPTDRKVGAGYTKENNGIGYYSSGFQFAYGKDIDYGSRVTYKVGNTIGFMLDMNIGEIQFYRDSKPVGKSIKMKEELLGKVEMYPVVLSERGLVVTVNRYSKVPSLFATPASSPIVPVKQNLHKHCSSFPANQELMVSVAD